VLQIRIIWQVALIIPPKTRNTKERKKKIKATCPNKKLPKGIRISSGPMAYYFSLIHKA